MIDSKDQQFETVIVPKKKDIEVRGMFHVIGWRTNRRALAVCGLDQVSFKLERATVEETGLPAKQIVRFIGLGSEPSLSAKERKYYLKFNIYLKTIVDPREKQYGGGGQTTF